MKHLKVFGWLLWTAAFLSFSTPLLAEPVTTAPKASPTQAAETDEAAKIRQHTGVISQIRLEDHRMVIKNRRGEHTLSLRSDTQVKRGRIQVPPTEMEPGMNVKVTYQKEEGEKIARIVRLPKE